jgi:hypothetical protein
VLKAGEKHGDIIVLGIVLAYGILLNRTRSRQELAISEEATKENYKQEERSSE